MLVVDRPDFRLDVTVQKDGPRNSLEVKQLHPQAQRPHWRRIAQLNLSDAELELFKAALTAGRS